MLVLPSYERPNSFPRVVSVEPRKLQALELPSLPEYLPTLPTTSRESPLYGYTLTSHIIPAAFPRQPCNLAPLIPTRESADARKRRVERLTDELLDSRIRSLNGIPHGRVQQHQLYNVLSCYCSQSSDRQSKMVTPLTLVAFHANGFPKEVCRLF